MVIIFCETDMLNNILYPNEMKTQDKILDFNTAVNNDYTIFLSFQWNENTR